MQVKSNCSSYPFHCIQTYPFLLQWCAGTSLGSRTSTEVLIHGLLSQCSLGVPKPWLRPIHRTLKGPQVVLKSVCLFSEAQVGKIPPRPLCSNLSFLPVDRCQIFVKFATWTKDILFRHVADITPQEKNCTPKEAAEIQHIPPRAGEYLWGWILNKRAGAWHWIRENFILWRHSPGLWDSTPWQVSQGMVQTPYQGS